MFSSGELAKAFAIYFFIWAVVFVGIGVGGTLAISWIYNHINIEVKYNGDNRETNTPNPK
jgi:hypothetical protein